MTLVTLDFRKNVLDYAAGISLWALIASESFARGDTARGIDHPAWRRVRRIGFLHLKSSQVAATNLVKAPQFYVYAMRHHGIASSVLLEQHESSLLLSLTSW